MGGFRPIILENFILRYELKVKARTSPDIFNGGFGSMHTIFP